MCVDSKPLRLNGVAPATWGAALGHSNPGAVIRLHVLTDGLSAPQQCMVRRLLGKHLPAGSSVHTIRVDAMLDELTQNYVGEAVQIDAMKSKLKAPGTKRFETKI